jgi:hypothetical protein
MGSKGLTICFQQPVAFFGYSIHPPFIGMVNDMQPYGSWTRGGIQT